VSLDGTRDGRSLPVQHRKAQYRQIQFINEGIDNADRVIFADVVVRPPVDAAEQPAFAIGASARPNYYKIGVSL
jgi:hypothetical protein